MTSRELGSRPVVLLPPWERAPRSRFESFEQILLDCDPSAAEYPLVVLLPAFAVESARGRAFRQQLVQRWHPSMVALLRASAVFSTVSPRFVIAVLALRPSADTDGRVRMLDLATAPLPDIDRGLDDARRLLKMQGGRREHGYVLAQIPETGDLSFRANDPRRAAKRGQLADFGQLAVLGDVFEILPPGVHVTADAFASGKVVRSGGGGGRTTRLLEGKNIGRDGRIALGEDDTALWADVPAERLLKVEDVVTRALHGAKVGAGFVWARVSDDEPPLAATSMVIVLRRRPQIPPEVADFVLRYLSSRHAPELIDSSTLGDAVRVTRSDLGALAVPLPDNELLDALDTVRYAQERTAEWRNEADTLMASIFDDESAAAARKRLLHESRTLRWRVTAAEEIDDFGTQVRHRYPLPVAYRWRVADAFLSSDPARGYPEVLKAAEVLLAYLANVALAIARDQGLTVGKVGDIRTKLGRGQGPTLGDWVAILDQIRGKRFRELDDRLGSADLREYFDQPGCREAQEWFTARRNDEAHGRSVDIVDLPAACARARAELLVLYRSAEFLVDLALLHVAAVRWDSLAGEGSATYRELTGDHVIVPQQNMIIPTSSIETDSLYLRDNQARLYLLRPYLVGRDCPTCHTFSVFHVDKVSGGSAQLKSLEHGHTVTAGDSDVTALRVAGFAGPG